MSEIENYSKEELLAELVRRGVVKAHRVATVDKIDVGRREPDNPEATVGVRFTQTGRWRLFLAMPEFSLQLDPKVSESDLIKNKVDAEFLAGLRWRFTTDDV